MASASIVPCGLAVPRLTDSSDGITVLDRLGRGVGASAEEEQTDDHHDNIDCVLHVIHGRAFVLRLAVIQLEPAGSPENVAKPRVEERRDCQARKVNAVHICRERTTHSGTADR